MAKLIKNTIVKVYEDPITCKKLEGEAKLLDYISTNHEATSNETQYWTVRFIKDGQKVDRFINVNSH